MIIVAASNENLRNIGEGLLKKVRIFRIRENDNSGNRGVFMTKKDHVIPKLNQQLRI